ncbi:MAG: triose-phosphate isomerase [Candidatus Hatepunaea meridiana]|nr:triose-phosphate isomerase [Candidatus Hatepunaea meridiana]
MRERIVAGNWKMNTTPQEGVKLACAVAEAIASTNWQTRASASSAESRRQTPSSADNVTVVICPPATHLAIIGEAVKSSSVELGAQNVHWADKGAYTSELSSAMLEAVGCKWVIIGHSERRSMFGETDETVNMRLRHIVKTDIRPIVCIGETLDKRQSEQTFAVLEQQLKVGLDGVELVGREGVVIAYEPVWAIGTGLNATPEQAQEAHRFIRGLLSKMYGKDIADNNVIQYGGSMNEKNANELMACQDVDGGLIGGASLRVDKFLPIIKAAYSQ